MCSARAPPGFMTIVGTGGNGERRKPKRTLRDASSFWAVGVMQFSEY